MMVKFEVHQIYQCLNKDCDFRFPASAHDPILKQCPKCHADLNRLVYQVPPGKNRCEEIGTNHLEIHGLLDNIRSTFNVGSIFRSADGCGVKSLFLCGITPTPEHPKLSKTSLGSECSVSWSYQRNAVSSAMELRNKGYYLIGLENSSDALSLNQCRVNLKENPILLAVGNEISGLDPVLRDLCDQTVFIPMHGYKRSLNVGIAFSIVVYFLRYGNAN